jgi:hypothetical protein
MNYAEEELEEEQYDADYLDNIFKMGAVGRVRDEDPRYGVRDIFRAECKSLEIDANLLKRLKRYQIGFAHKNKEHVEFFGGNLTGVQVVRFLPSDRDKWFDEVMETDESLLESLLHALPTINKEWHIGADAMNLSCVWLAHAILNSKLSDAQKHDGMLDVFLVLQYKYLTSILSHSFRYPADKAVAEATYASLNYKFGLKVYGSWSAFLIARAEKIIVKGALHYTTIAKMEHDSDIINLLVDSRDRIKDMIKNIMSIHINLRNQGTRIATTSSVTTDYEGEEILRDRTKSLLMYGRYLNSIVTDKGSFIHTELVNVIENLVHTMPPKLFITTLEWISHNYRQQGASGIEELLNQTLVHAWSFMSENRDLIKNNRDLAELLGKLKGVYMASRSTDPAMIALRDLSDDIVRTATGNKNDSVIAATRTGVLLYLVLRTMCMKHYG